jgi:hypothetical protein
LTPLKKNEGWSEKIFIFMTSSTRIPQPSLPLTVDRKSEKRY